MKKRNIKLSFLEKIDIFKNLDHYEKLKLIDGLESRVLALGEIVFNEGEVGDNFYIIEEGTVECLKSQGVDELGYDKEFLFVRELKTSEHFGELALIH